MKRAISRIVVVPLILCLHLDPAFANAFSASPIPQKTYASLFQSQALTLALSGGLFAGFVINTDSTPPFLYTYNALGWILGGSVVFWLMSAQGKDVSSYEKLPLEKLAELSAGIIQDPNSKDEDFQRSLEMSLLLIDRTRTSPSMRPLTVIGHINAARSLQKIGDPAAGQEHVRLAFQLGNGIQITMNNRMAAWIAAGTIQSSLSNPQGAVAEYRSGIEFVELLLSKKEPPRHLRIKKNELAFIQSGDKYPEHKASHLMLMQTLEGFGKRFVKDIQAINTEATFEYAPRLMKLIKTEEAVTNKVVETQHPVVKRVTLLLNQHVRDLYERDDRAPTDETLEKVLTTRQEVLSLLPELPEDQRLSIEVTARHHIGYALMRRNELYEPENNSLLEAAKREFLEAERLGKQTDIRLEVRMMNWNSLASTYATLEEDDLAREFYTIAKKVTHGLKGEKLSRPRGPGFDIPEDQWNAYKKMKGFIYKELHKQIVIQHNSAKVSLDLLERIQAQEAHNDEQELARERKQNKEASQNAIRAAQEAIEKEQLSGIKDLIDIILESEAKVALEAALDQARKNEDRVSLLLGSDALGASLREKYLTLGNKAFLEAHAEHKDRVSFLTTLIEGSGFPHKSARVFASAFSESGERTFEQMLEVISLIGGQSQDDDYIHTVAQYVKQTVTQESHETLLQHLLDALPGEKEFKFSISLENAGKLRDKVGVNLSIDVTSDSSGRVRLGKIHTAVWDSLEERDTVRGIIRDVSRFRLHMNGIEVTRYSNWKQTPVPKNATLELRLRKDGFLFTEAALITSFVSFGLASRLLASRFADNVPSDVVAFGLFSLLSLFVGVVAGIFDKPSHELTPEERINQAIRAANLLQHEENEKAQHLLSQYPKFKFSGSLVYHRSSRQAVVIYGRGKSTLATIFAGFGTETGRLLKHKQTEWVFLTQGNLVAYKVNGVLVVGKDTQDETVRHFDHIERRDKWGNVLYAAEKETPGFVRVPLGIHLKPEYPDDPHPQSSFKIEPMKQGFAASIIPVTIYREMANEEDSLASDLNTQLLAEMNRLTPVAPEHTLRLPISLIMFSGHPRTLLRDAYGDTLHELLSISGGKLKDGKTKLEEKLFGINGRLQHYDILVNGQYWTNRLRDALPPGLKIEIVSLDPYGVKGMIISMALALLFSAQQLLALPQNDSSPLNLSRAA